MSIKKLFQKNSQAITVSKYLKKTDVGSLGDGIESLPHLSQSLKQRDRFIPAVNYDNPEEFAKFGSAQQYYDNSFDYVRDYYPYDGSDFEITKFGNDLNPLGNFMYTEYYPRSTGYVILASTYGSVTSDASGYYSSSVTQYIQTKGGPHSGTIYSQATNRTSNLEFGGPSGSTVEFFFKKETGIPSCQPSCVQSEKQVIFDLWNNELSSSHAYGRMRVELFSGSEDRFKVTMMSGTTGFFTQSVPTTGGLSDYLVSGSWHNYSFVFNTSGSGTPYIDFYVDGACVETNITASGHQAGVIGTVTGSLLSNLGALRYAVSGTKDVSEAAAMLGYGQLSASLDEFRFWKENRTAEDVGQYWFTPVYGGSNKYDANVALGVYYKFNEGITLTSSIDEIVLDYSGRVSNGLYIGYSEATSRNTGSAINDMSLTSVREAGDPIVRSSNPVLLSQKSYFTGLGRQYDYGNSSYLMNMVPGWVYEEDEDAGGELSNLNQILASYLDTLYLQVSELSKIKDIRYTSGSLTGSLYEFPYNDRLLSNSGLQVPEIFENIGVLGQLLKRDEQINFDQELVRVKNAIYKNIYNNLNYIYKSKGNEKSIRNLIRCYGVDENILDLSVYSDNEVYELDTKYSAAVSNKKYIDFSGLRTRDSSDAVVYQYYDGTADAYGIVTGSSELESYGFTLEGEFVFPRRGNIENLGYTPPQVISSSLFGFHTPADTSPTVTDTTWADIGDPTYSDQGFQIYAIKKPAEYSELTSPDYLVKDVYFEVRDSSNNIVLTSDIYRNVYENERWNLGLSLRNEKYPFADQVDGTTIGGSTNFTLSLYGVNYDSGIKRNYFYKTTSLTSPSGSQSLTFPKKVYVGAHRTNFSGALLTSTDVRASSIRYWSQVIPTGTLDIHARDVDNFGHKDPYQQAYTFQGTQIPQVFIPNIETLALNWDFANLSTADSSGIITVSDFSSGSNATGYEQNYQGTVFSNVNKRQLGGRGEFFASDSSVVVKQYPYTEKQQLPEYVLSRDMVDVRSTDVEIFRPNQKVNNFYFSIEKSPYKNISKRMLQFFASLSEMNNLIGEPVNTYRPNYKNMEKLREVFFRRVGNVPNFEKYAEYYKWVDYAMGQIAAQLFPASSKHTLGTRTLVENHLLERPKYKWTYVGRKRKIDNPPHIPPPEAYIGGKGNKCLEFPGWKFSHAPLSLAQNTGCEWWKFRAHRSLPAFGVTDTGVINTRTAVLSASQGFRVPTLALYPPAPGELTYEDGLSVLCIEADLHPIKVGGINQYPNKRRNLLTGSFDSFEPIEDCSDVLNPFKKTRVNFRGSLVLNNEAGRGRDYKGEEVMPFSVYSSSLSPDTSGYWNYLNNAGLVNIDLANLHEDSILPMGHSVPLQGPFTRTHVGGYQARHVAPFKTFERKEKYKLEIASGTGSISILTTESLSPGLENSTPKGYYLRGLGSKSPVNIANVLTTTGSSISGVGVNVLGNFSKNYQVVQTVGRANNNMDFVFNTANYNNGAEMGYTGSMASAFIIPPSRRISTGKPGDGAEGLSFAYSGSADYAAPRQIATRRTNRTIFVNQFAAPGSILDSKQQYRDVASDQFASNNALPFRNMLVRKLGNLSYRNQGTGLGAGAGLHGYLRLYTGWGGFQQNPYNELDAIGGELETLNSGDPYPIGVAKIYGSASISNIPSGSFVALHKTQRNTIRRLKISGTYDTATTYTASIRDNGFVIRPVPDADRTQWFQNLSGSNTEGSALFSKFFLSSSRYPLNISLITSSLTPRDVAALGTSCLFSNSAGNTNFLWGSGQDFVPWSELRQGETNAGRYFNENLIYNIVPPNAVDGNINGKEIISASYVEEDRASNSITYNYYRRYKETPITSKYKPLIHKLDTFPGTPSATSRDTINVGAVYSYGNELQGFANKALNILVNPKSLTKHKSHVLKRPYEIFRNNFIEKLPNSVTGIDFYKQFLYSETVYPREIYTYLSESRSRLAFQNYFWKEDQPVSSTNMSAFLSYYQLTDYDAYSTGQTNNIGAYNRQSSRLRTPFITSQGYQVIGTANRPYNSLDASSVSAAPSPGSMWALDSYLYSDSIESLKTVLTASVPVLLADATTMASGELMMLNYGTVDDGITDSANTNTSASWTRNDSVTSQYVYGVPSVTTGSITATAAAATATLTALIYQGQGNATANAELEFGASSDGEQLADVLGVSIEIQDLTQTKKFDFVIGSNVNIFDSAANEYKVGVQNADSSWFTLEQCRNQLYLAIEASIVDSAPLGIATLAKSGVNTITFAAGSAGTAWNSRTVTSTDTSIAGITPTTFAGGTDHSLNSLTLILNDVAHGVVSYPFDAATTVAGSTAGIIGCQDATSTSLVAQAIAQTVALSQAAGAINISVAAIASNSIQFAATSIGSAMNGKAIAGTLISSGPPYGSSTAFAGGSTAGTHVVSYNLPDALRPGGAYTRPAWTAGTERRYVDGVSKGQIARQQYPFYNTYEDYVQDAKAAGQEYTIVPEFRISEHLNTYAYLGNTLSLVQKTLELTGANHDNYDSQMSSDFIPRYATSDLLEYLDPFMVPGTSDLEFNKYPRQFGLKSDAILKLLPYDGFYPQLRTTQLATLFSQSYSPASAGSWGGTSGSEQQRWRTLHRPFFAPGILYNSIKSGVSVEYPVWRDGKNSGSFMETSAYTPLAGALSGTLNGTSAVAAQIPGNRRRRQDGDSDNFDFDLIGVNKFFWSEKLPFEAILKPLEYISDKSGEGAGIRLSDTNPYLINDITGSVSTSGSVDDLLYRLGISNFLAAVPEFFLKKKENDTYMTKFVASIPASTVDSKSGTAPANDNEPRTVAVDSKSAYIMEIGLKKTDNFNLYSNPYAFGIPTSTGSVDWDSIKAAGNPLATKTQTGAVPEGRAWPLHRGEFAPFTPPYYYGPSLVRIIYIPPVNGEVTLDDIINGENIYTEFVNENGYYYGFSSGSFVNEAGAEVSTTDYPPYQWNRAWKNRMDLDASVVINNSFPTELGSVSPFDRNKWVIMPKWECPVLDFSSSAADYDFSSSLAPGSYSTPTYGMWHQYGVEPRTNEGVYMYISDVGETDLEYRLTGNPLGSTYNPASPAALAATSQVQKVRKVPKFVSDLGLQVKSLANLVGFREDEIMPSGQWVPERAKRLGELAENNEKTMSEAIIAMPFWKTGKDQEYVCMTMTADKKLLGPRIKDFRRAFTKYSLPPSLRNSIKSMLPPDYPDVSQIILPFGEDDYDESFADYDVLTTPIVYLFEHSTTLTKQDLADIWQGIMPDITRVLKKNTVSVDHYMPGELVEETPTVFPEIIRKQLDLGVNPTGHPRVDLIDVTGRLNGFNPDIRWLVFKVKQRGPAYYHQTIINEINDGPGSLSFQNIFGYIADDLPPQLRDLFVRQKSTYTENLFLPTAVGEGRNTYNWPYDYCSLIELSKLTATTGFRPELKTEVSEYRGERAGPGSTLIDPGVVLETPTPNQPSARGLSVATRGTGPAISRPIVLSSDQVSIVNSIMGVYNNPNN